MFPYFLEVLYSYFDLCAGPKWPLVPPRPLAKGIVQATKSHWVDVLPCIRSFCNHADGENQLLNGFSFQAPKKTNIQTGNIWQGKYVPLRMFVFSEGTYPRRWSVWCLWCSRVCRCICRSPEYWRTARYGTSSPWRDTRRYLNENRKQARKLSARIACQLIWSWVTRAVRGGTSAVSGVSWAQWTHLLILCGAR